MVADGREKIADFIHFITEKGNTGIIGPGWRLVGDELFRLRDGFKEWIFKECVYVSLRTFEFGNLTKGNEIGLN